MKFATPALLAALLLSPGAAAQSVAPLPAATAAPNAWAECGIRSIETLRRNPSAMEMRCRFGARGPGQFGLLSYLDVPVYRPATPLPGTHVVGVPGMPHPALGESYEQWEWRVLRTSYGPSVRNVQNDLMQLDPVFMSMIRRFEAELRRRGIPASRRETYRPAERQAWLFQQGRVRPGPFATTTLTSWHSRVDRLGRAAARAADYNVSAGQPAALSRRRGGDRAAGLRRGQQRPRPRLPPRHRRRDRRRGGRAAHPAAGDARHPRHGTAGGRVAAAACPGGLAAADARVRQQPGALLPRPAGALDAAPRQHSAHAAAGEGDRVYPISLLVRHAPRPRRLKSRL